MKCSRREFVATAGASAFGLAVVGRASGRAPGGIRFYSISGKRPANDATYVYNPTADRWKRGEPLPSPYSGIQGAASVVHGKKIYVIGGREMDTGSPTSGVYIYDTTGDKWSTGAPMPTPRAKLGHNYDVLDGKVYVMGGEGETRKERLNTNEVYDLEADSWDTSVSDAPHSQSFPYCVTHDRDLVYLTGNTNSSDAPSGLVQRYDPATDSWSELTPDPERATDCMLTRVGSTVHVLGGGAAGDEGATDAHREYDLEADTWTMRDTPLPYVWAHGRAEHIDGTPHVFLGNDEVTIENIVELWRLNGGTWEQLAPPPGGRWNTAGGKVGR